MHHRSARCPDFRRPTRRAARAACALSTCCAVLLAGCAGGPAVKDPGPSGAVGTAVSAPPLDLDALWDFSQPARSEARFREAQARATPLQVLLLQTQIARTRGLQGDLPGARRLLQDMSAAVERADDAELGVRHALELGRTYASAAHRPADIRPADRDAARSLFLRAAEQAQRALLDGLAVDALHMMVFVDPAPALQIAWNRRALAVMEASSQAAARRWEGSLRLNLGLALKEYGDLEAARESFEASRRAYERWGRTRGARVAHGLAGHVLRLQGRLAEALELQTALDRAWAADGTVDADVLEELEQLHRAMGDEVRAREVALRRQALRQ